MIGIVLVLLTIGVPVAATLFVGGLAFIVLAMDIRPAILLTSGELWQVFTNYTLIPVPLFMFMGELVLVAGVGKDLFNIAEKWAGRMPGGLALATTITCAAFGTVSGSSVAATATIGSTAIPEMLERGYDSKLATGSVGAAGGLAHLIPPSGLAIVYASLAETSVGKQLMAGLIPGIILAIAFAFTIWILILFNPRIAPKAVRATWGERFRILSKGLAPLVIVVAVLGTIYTGIATVVEASAVGAFACLIVAIYKRAKFKDLLNCALRTARTTCYIMLIIGAASIFTWAMSYYMIPQNIVRIIVEIGMPPLMVIIGIQLLYIALGMFIDPISMLVITMPIALPLIIQFGFDPIWFGVLALINIEMALITPPVGFHLYIIRGIAPPSISMGDIIKGCLMFFVADSVVLGLILVFPHIAMFLPDLMVG